MRLAKLQPKTQRGRSATIVDRRVTLLFNTPNHVLALLGHHHLLRHHHPTRKPKGRRKCIWKFEDGDNLDLDYYHVEDCLPEDDSCD
jgi:hypothetical protein